MAGVDDDGALQLNWQVADGPAASEWPQLPAYKQVEVVVIWRDGKQIPAFITARHHHTLCPGDGS